MESREALDLGFWKAAKAFIGPIGDDLPSLIPIVFALAVFFSAFNVALENFDSKNMGFSDDLDALKIARVLRSNGYLVDYSNFEHLCSLVEVRSVKYVAGIAEMNSTPEDSLDPSKPYDYSIEERLNSGSGSVLERLFFKDSEGNVFSCTNLEDPDSQLSGDLVVSKKTIIRAYSVILEKERPSGLGLISAPMQLVVVVWR